MNTTASIELPALVVDAEVVDPMGRADAERLDKRIRLLVGTINDNLDKLYELVEQAKAGAIHKALDYPSWTAYVADTIKIQVRLDRGQRRELVGYLSGEGMSQRAIADVVGVDQKTVSNDLRRPGEENSSPEPELVDAGVFFDDDQEAADCSAMAEVSDDDFDSVLADARSQDDLSRENVARLSRERVDDKNAVTGRDGKTYRPKPKDDAAKQKPRRGPLTDDFRRAVSELDKAVNRLAKLAADDRFNRNQSELCGRNLGDLLRIFDRLDDDVLWRLSDGFHRHELDDPALVKRIVWGDDRVT
jgi:hypothetical protein